MFCLLFAGLVANNVDPDEMPRFVMSHLGLHCLLRHVCPNTYRKNGTFKFNIKHSLGKISRQHINGIFLFSEKIGLDISWKLPPKKVMSPVSLKYFKMPSTAI